MATHASILICKVVTMRELNSHNNKQVLKFITGRNEVVAKVIFLHLSVILFTGGVCLSACWDTTPPPRTRQTSPGPGRPPQTRQTPPRPGRPPPGPGRPPRDQADPPGTRQTPLPPETRHPPPKQTPAYGLRAAGTHPTGMHSCLFINYYSYSRSAVNSELIIRLYTPLILTSPDRIRKKRIRLCLLNVWTNTL